MTPKEAWSGTKPLVNHFSVFDCISHVHIPDNKTTKLDDKSVRCIILGVNEASKTYILYDPVSHKIIVSKNVKFEEENSWDWSKSHEEVIITDLDWGESDKESLTINNNGGNIKADHRDNSTKDIESDHSDESNKENRPPTWTKDYESGEGLSKEENNAYQTLFASSDPTSFGDAVKI
ncbi:uncharacterized protein [Aristolochia californica]|uniref:uncharacterized protein n=1 Tax=Aristolochia californica TaxID=171875 RepID=UPI0035D585F8